MFAVTQAPSDNHRDFQHLMATPAQLGHLLFALAALIGLAGCGQQQPAASHAVVPPDVAVVTVKPRPVTLTKELPGRITPIRIAEVRPRVSGIIIERSFEQGSLVKEGSVLYRIDPKPFEVELDSAKAALAKAEATQFLAARQEERQKSLLTGQSTSEAQYDIAVAARRQADAEVAAQKAAVARAELNLDYATIRAPITGRIGRALVTEGALVGKDEATHLATIQQLDPIYADFTQSVTEANQLKRELAKGRLKQTSPHAAVVHLSFEDGTVYPSEGYLLFSDVSVDPSTGQVTLRGEFPNPNAELLPGMYVRVQIEEAIDAQAITVPVQSVQRNNAGGSEVYAVNDEGRAVLQPVRAGRVLGDQIVIDEGLQPGNRVIVEGFQKLTPGTPVHAVPW
jgi:membrane fusion protein, multidrug efflux system